MATGGQKSHTSKAGRRATLTDSEQTPEVKQLILRLNVIKYVKIKT